MYSTDFVLPEGYSRDIDAMQEVNIKDWKANHPTLCAVAIKNLDNENIAKIAYVTARREISRVESEYENEKNIIVI